MLKGDLHLNMKITITTNRLPNKYPKGSVYEVTEQSLNYLALMALVNNGEARIGKPKKVKKAKKVVKKSKKK